MLRRGDRVEIFEKSENEGWQSYMDEHVGVHGAVTTSINGPDVGRLNWLISFAHFSDPPYLSRSVSGHPEKTCHPEIGAGNRAKNNG